MSLFSSIKKRDILSARPVSDCFGLDRGKPIDRYYIERFLAEHKSDINGDVFEIGENTYTLQFSEKLRSSSVFTYESREDTDHTVGDLCDRGTLKPQVADCFICTQTFNFIYDIREAIGGAKFMLKPGGKLLATLACMAPISKFDADRWGDYWRLTAQSAGRLFAEAFGSENVKILSYGNTGAAALFMKGYALEDLPRNFDLDQTDPYCPLIIGVRAVNGH